MPISKINESQVSHIACGSFSIGAFPLDISTCITGEAELNFDNSDASLPISITGAVTSVNGEEGIVVLDADDIDDSSTANKFMTVSERNKLNNIETAATADQTDAEIETAYNNRVNVVSQVEAETGTSTTPRRWTAQRVAQAIAALASGSSSVTSVNSKIGAVVINPDDLDDSATTNKFTTQTEINKLSGIENNATADQTAGEIETAYNTQVSVVSQAEAEAGSATTVRRWTAQRVAQAIAAQGGGGGGGAVSSVNSQTGDVTLDADDIDDTSTTNKFTTQVLIDKLNNIEANATADQTGSEIASAIDAELSNTYWRDGFVNTLGTVINVSTATLYEPSGTGDDDRGDALVTAVSEMATNDILYLAGGFVYELSAPLTIAVGGAKVIGNGAVLRRAAGVQTDWILQVQGVADYRAVISDLEIDGNYGNVEIVSGAGNRCEGLRISGGGPVDAYNVYAHSAPVIASGQSSIVDDSAVNFFVIGGGHKKLVNCKADYPSYANYRIQATTSEFIGCDSFVTTFTGNYGRLYVMDGAAVRSCVINGGTWKVQDSMKINANFDPTSVNDSAINADWCEKLVLSNIIMDFGTGHTNPDGDSYIKFDNVRRVVCSNIVQTHSDVFMADGSNPLTVAGTGFKWWILNSGVVESLFTVGSLCKEAHFENIIADGYLKLAGSSGGPYTDMVTVRNCAWGVNAHIHYAIESCNHAKMLVIENSEFHNVTGFNGGDRKVFNNAQSNKNQQLRISNCFVSTFWTGNNGFLFGKCDKLGDIATEGIDLLDKNTTSYVNQQSGIYFLDSSGDPEVAFSPNDYVTYVLNNSSLRLITSPRVGDPYTALLGRNILREYDFTANKWVEGSRCELGTGTYADTHVEPSDPGIDDGDWFPSITSDPGGRIVNLDCGAGGNGYAVFWTANISGDFIEDPSIRLY